MKLILSTIITTSCLMLSQCRLVSDTIDYALYHDYYPALKWHQYKFAEAECRERHIDLRYFLAMMNTESEFKDSALSCAGAIGVCQVMPFHVSDPATLRDPATNIKMGAKIMSDNLRLTRGDYLIALAKYHAGPHYNLSKYRWWNSYVYKIHCNATEAI